MPFQWLRGVILRRVRLLLGMMVFLIRLVERLRQLTGLAEAVVTIGLGNEIAALESVIDNLLLVRGWQKRPGSVLRTQSCRRRRLLKVWIQARVGFGDVARSRTLMWSVEMVRLGF
jgi:hypothetical protein